jgi:two-component system, NarL family, sensor histidine kinase UhpB
MQLVRRVAALILLLLVVFCASVAVALRDDVRDEIEASSRLGELMQLAGAAVTDRDDGVAAAAVLRLLQGERLRHVSVELERAGHPGEALRLGKESSFLVDLFVALLPDFPQTRLTHRIPLGPDALLIRPDPGSEVGEIIADATRTLATLLLFALATLALTWFAAHRALAPVRELELRLQRIGQDVSLDGELRAPAQPGHDRLPTFKLREFDRIARAIDRLASQLHGARAAQHHLAQRLIAVQEAERAELARELHDETGQSLTAIAVSAAFVDRHAGRADPQALRDCARDIAEQVRSISAQVRGMLGRLRPHGLEGLGTLEALRELIHGWRQRAGEVKLELSLPDELPPLELAQALALYRGLQEALTNVWRHSAAHEVRVLLTLADQTLVLRVSDDGTGRAEWVRERLGAGLLGMAERAAAVGGVARVLDQPQGVCIELRLPLVASAPSSPLTATPAGLPA